MVVRASSNEVDKNFFTPRDYQIELLDKACQGNVIVPLGTGSGKTFIAVLLIKEHTEKLIAENGAKRAFFLVDKVLLVDQQAAHIEYHTTLRVGKMHGRLNTDVWSDRSKFDTFIAEHHVVVLTAQVFLNLLNHAFFKMSNAALLIFDECHHALGSRHAYRVIMDRYAELPENARPKILGLTASLINSKTPPEKLERLLEKLELVMNSSIETASDLVSAAKYGAKPQEFLLECKDFIYDECQASKKVISLLEELRAMCMNCQQFHPDFDVDPRKPLMEAINRTLSVFRQMGPWCAWKVCQLFQRQLKKHTGQELLPDMQVLFLQMGETTMRLSKKVLDGKVHQVKCYSDLKPLLPHRIVRLMEILEYYSPNNIAKIDRNFVFCGIIFVEQRYVAYVMNTLLRAIAKWDKEKFGYLVPDFVIGYNSANISSEEMMALHKRQEEVLRKFRQKHLNLLVATSVLEEGVDVKQCNVIIRFDRPTQYRSYIQSKGRARKEGARYFMLVEQSDLANCHSDLNDFFQIEQMLLKRYRTAHNPPDGMPLCNEKVDSLVEPYIVESTGARVTMSSAISLVNRYCAKLPSDIFTRLVPQNRIIPVNINETKAYKAELLLPINSPIKDGIMLTEPMKTKKLAQMAVALECCRRLHERKELNDYLLPVGKDTITLTALDDDPDEFIPNMSYKVGSARRKQLYDKKMAKGLNGALPDIGAACLIYVMEMDLLKAVTGAANPKNRKIVNPIDTEFCFGFLSKKKIPNIPSFPVFLRQGRMQANIFLAKSTLQVDAEMMELLKAFHHYIFDNVLRLVKGGLAFVPEKAPVSILIVPLRRERNELTNQVDFKLDYTYVRNVVSSIGEMPRVPTEEERRAFKFDPAKFQDAVVMPWYRDKEHPSFYYVAEIIDASPSSRFPDEKFSNFNEYFVQKYNIEIYDQQQPLLDVDYTSSRLNLLMPRHTSRSRSRVSEERKPRETNSQGQILVPELVDVHPIAASLWNVIAALPTLLYRINCLLLANELRETIVSEALGMDNSVPEDHVWPPLDYPTPMDDVDVKPVHKIQHLRREYDERVAREKELESKDSNEYEECSFEIGVWDPELGRGLEQLATDRSKQDNWNGDELEDTMGLLSNGSTLRLHGDMSDDEEEEAVVFDFMNTLGKEKAELFAPRENIESTGWDDLEVHEEAAPNDVNMPLSVNSGSAMIDSHALMVDLSEMSWGMGHIGGHCSLLSSAPNNAAASGTVGASSKLPVENREITSTEMTLAAQRKQPIQLYLDSMERLEDTDRELPKNGRNEESVDLIQFVDDEETLNEARLSPLSYSMKENCLLDEDLGELSHESHVLVPMQAELPAAIANASEQIQHDLSSLKEGAMQRLNSDADLLLQASQEDEMRQSTLSNKSQTSRREILAPQLDWMTFSFEEDSLDCHPYGVSPCTLLQALTMSNASDGINLERLETVGDSFLKYAVTDYLFHMNPEQHEGKLSFARSKEVSNCNLYRLGKKHNLPSLMVGAKFDPNDSWLPPCYAPTSDFKAPNSSDAEECDKIMENVLEGNAAIEQTLFEVKVRTGWDEADSNSEVRKIADGVETITFPRGVASAWDGAEEISPLPYNMLTQQNLSDKSIADAVEALIGAHLLELGPSATLKFMKWIGLKVLTEPVKLEPPLLKFIDTPEKPEMSLCMLNKFWIQFQFSKLEYSIGYRFEDRAYLLQAFTHASDFILQIFCCVNRLEFLGDAVLDYVITRFLFQHPRQYSPGVLTDLRSALVNNTIFASLAVKYNFHKHFVAMCPGLHHMIEKFVRLCSEKNFSGANFNAEMYMVTTEEEIDEGEEEDIEVPKAMGDIFESVAGAIYLDSGRSLDTVWRVFYNLMKETIEECCNNPPKSPIRELLELEPERARFSKLERILETGKVRVTVDIQGKCRFTGMGRSYRIAKCTAAKRALRYLRRLKEQQEKADAKA
ncbi:unnamed protein product [Toxocara canis]|uniref:Endoribonuclease dcr-1 n=2 Tax=Toxocara canis TaxID=6265 RepID=A0A183UH96_TOXCA|nr:unnamed protein product [Toxocara canis]